MKQINQQLGQLRDNVPAWTTEGCRSTAESFQRGIEMEPVKSLKFTGYKLLATAFIKTSVPSLIMQT